MLKKRKLSNSRFDMTLPDERYRAVVQTRMFLHELLNPKITPRIPKKIRQQASWCLRHYPSEWEMKRAADGAPDVFQERMEAVTRLIAQYEQSKSKENET